MHTAIGVGAGSGVTIRIYPVLHKLDAFYVTSICDFSARWIGTPQGDILLQIPV